MKLKVLAASLVVMFAFVGTAQAAPRKAPSLAAFRNLEKQVRLLTRQVKLQEEQIRFQESKTSLFRGSGTGVFVSPGIVELKSPGGSLILNSEGLSTHGPSLSTAMPIYFNRFACPSLPVELYGGAGKNFYSSSLFSC